MSGWLREGRGASRRPPKGRALGQQSLELGQAHRAGDGVRVF